MKKKDDKYAAIEDPNTTSLEIGITGIKIQDMAAKYYLFNWDGMLSFESDTGPYLVFN
jgi:arginyl-tRNA synthetase